MSPLEQAIVTIIAAIISTAGGIAIDRARRRREDEKERDIGIAGIEEARIKDEGDRRKEVEQASQDIRSFLRGQVKELKDALTRIEDLRGAEREKWQQLVQQLSIKNLEFELQRKRDLARIAELEEEASQVDDLFKTLRARIAGLESAGIVLTAQLDQEVLERKRLQEQLAREKNQIKI